MTEEKKRDLKAAAPPLRPRKPLAAPKLVKPPFPKSGDFKYKIAYCTECRPVLVFAAGSMDRPIRHRTKDGEVHEKNVKSIDVPTQQMRPNEQPQEFLDRLGKEFKDKLT